MRGAHSPQVILCLQGRNTTGASVCCEHTRHSMEDDDAAGAGDEFEFPAVSDFREEAALSSLAASSLEMNSSCKIALDAGSCCKIGGFNWYMRIKKITSVMNFSRVISFEKIKEVKYCTVWGVRL